LSPDAPLSAPLSPLAGREWEALDMLLYILFPPFRGTTASQRRIMSHAHGDDITAAYSAVATIGSLGGTYPITPSLVDPKNQRTDKRLILPRRFGNYP